jgi:hypothetical protein
MASVNPEQQFSYQQEAGTFLTIMDEMAPHTCLDYSVESLQRLEQFINEHFDPPGSKFVGESLPLGIGCYVGEVIIRHLGGHWNLEGRPEVNNIGPIDAIYPIEKAQNRFKNGRQDSLAWYYHSIAKRAYEAGYNPSKATGTHGHDDGVMGFFKGLFSKK